ncbi:hypothetical protein CAPI_09430 [Corynebacterium capitovis DSM 44611]|uniref:DUF5129 domain-containing protein n=1 Tax=Corynebacterium capitovis TaxID=131081 RepID=UPI0003824D25|nr:DUF5129 domain-containing protein [Corynebacterium capitovis]WKD58409.1 hypothetical protein CAPI_09430 [Corynebacterium capitovis DSM 44611]
MPSLAQIASVAALSGLLALGAGGAVALSQDPPIQSDYTVATTAAPNVVLDDPNDVLSSEEEQRVLADATRLTVPNTVRTVHYLVLGSTRDNVNDSVEEFLRANRPEEIGEDKFSDGVLILGAGTDQRKVFAFAGEDVADQIHLREGERLEEVNDAMKPGMRDNNLPAALFAAARKATDPEELAEYNYDNATGERTASILGTGGLTGAVAAGAGSLLVARRNKRAREIAQAREDYELVTREYAELAGRLDGIDVRAHSLTSAFADAELRKQWAEVRDRFLGLHETVSGASGIGSINMSDDKEVWHNHALLADAATTVRHTSTAEDNVNRLFGVENGDAAARRSGIADLRADVQEAIVTVKDSALRGELESVRERLDRLDRSPESPTFMDDFVRVLADYRITLDAVKKHEFSDVKEETKLQRPALYESTYFYPDVVPFVVLNSWHTSNVEAAQAASSGGTNTSFSSGFSGAGGSSSY